MVVTNHSHCRTSCTRGEGQRQQGVNERGSDRDPRARWNKKGKQDRLFCTIQISGCMHASIYPPSCLPPFWRLQRLMDEATTDSVSQFINLFMLLARSSVSALLYLWPLSGCWLAGGRACTIWIAAVLRNTASCDQPQSFACENEAAIEGNAMPSILAPPRNICP